MKMLVAGAAILASFAIAAGPVAAANARHPNQNVDRRVDRGGPTGDARTEQLNQQQLDMARSQNGGGAPSMGGSSMSGSSMGAPMTGSRP